MRSDVNLPLANEAADAGNFCHARNRGELVADEIILQGAQLAKIVGGAAPDRVPEHLAEAGRVGAERRRDARGRIFVTRLMRSSTRVRAK